MHCASTVCIVTRLHILNIHLTTLTHPRESRRSYEKCSSNVFIIFATINLGYLKGNRTKAPALLPSYLVTPTCGRNSLRINTLRNYIHAWICLYGLEASSVPGWSEFYRRHVTCRAICSVSPRAIRVMLIVPNTPP